MLLNVPKSTKWYLTIIASAQDVDFLQDENERWNCESASKIQIPSGGKLQAAREGRELRAKKEFFISFCHHTIRQVSKLQFTGQNALNVC